MGEVGKSEVLVFSADEFSEFTNGYSDANFLGKTEFGKLYRGEISDAANQMGTRQVTIKLRDLPIAKDIQSRLNEDINLLRHPSVNDQRQNLAKLIGYCCQPVGFVYDINPRGTLEKLILQDNFTWLQRIKVGSQLAGRFFLFQNYDPMYFVCDINAAHIMVDQDYNPVLVEFGTLPNRIFDYSSYIQDRNLSEDLRPLVVGGQSITRDTSSFGVLLLSLIAKRNFDIWCLETKPALLAKRELQRNVLSVHELFNEDPDYDVYDAHKIIKLVTSCIEYLPRDRPTMTEIFESLHALHVVRLRGIGAAGKSEMQEFSACQLREIIGEFRKENFLGDTQFGKLYRGVILNGPNMKEAHAVTVKLWDDSVVDFSNPEDILSKLTDEVYLLQHPSVKEHGQNLVKPIGYCRKCECLGIVYDLNPRDTLHNLMLRDDFTWSQRIKVALQFARLLVFFHNYNPPFIVRNISAAHIMVDQDCNPVLFDFGMLVGDLFGNMEHIPNGTLHGAPGYEDVHFLTAGGWSLTRDVFSYGVLLLSLISKKVSDISTLKNSIVLWAKNSSRREMMWSSLKRNFKHVHKIFKEDPDYDIFDAWGVMRLAMNCIEFFPENRPRMKEIVECLQALYVVQHKGMIEGEKPALLKYMRHQLREFTSEFHDQNFLGKTQFGKLYRGKIDGAKEVTVKIWDCDTSNAYHAIGQYDMDHWSKLTDEFYLLQHPTVTGHCQNLAKPMGCCRQYELPGIVYDLNPKGTLRKLITEDNFTWLQRIKVAFQFSRLLVFFHSYDPPFILRNICPAHIVVDQNNNLMLLDFGMLMGGFFGNMRNLPEVRDYGSIGYMDPHNYMIYGYDMVAFDVFGFGVLLLSLVAKRDYDGDADRWSTFWPWAREHYGAKMTQTDLKSKIAHVRGVFKRHRGYNRADVVAITKLAMSCIEFHPKDRPTMENAFERLQALHVVQSHSNELGIKK